MPSEYEPTGEPLIGKMSFDWQTHSMGKNSRGEAAAVAGNARQREKARKEVRWITDNCEQVPQGLWQSSASKSSNSTALLYDCGTGARLPSSRSEKR